MDCIEQTRLWIDSHALIMPGSRIIAAVSGGPDSMAMLTILSCLSEETGFTLAAACFDHRIRDKGEREKMLVLRYCEKLGIETMTGSGDVPLMARRSKTGMEETARNMRYDFLETEARRWRADSVALGHNRDDQAETILHHIIRGSGWKGLSGMPVRRGIFIRPVLSSSRAELREFLGEKGIRYAIDKSNRDNTILRNRIRNRLLPMIRRDFNPSIDDALIRTGENIAEGWKLLDDQLGSLHLIEDSGDIIVKVGDVMELSGFQIYLHLDRILRTRFGIYRDIEKIHFDAAKRLIQSGRSGSMIQLPHGLEIWKEHDSIRIRSILAGIGDKTIEPSVIPSPGSYDLPSWDLTLTIERRGPAKEPRDYDHPGEEFAGIEFPVIIRARSRGDRIIPAGMKGRKKLSDIFIDKKIPLKKRGLIPVFEDKKGIFWVPGIVAAERTKVKDPSEGTVIITLKDPGGVKI
ncbi:MAG: tRNA lysidine(34) synthetase TilS [Candidatus Krumholzibacteriota bacterium]|nr:tRNA lysidine(34) synthetase TilS [Candidatus Krumholzibacteriota bacterium]